MLWRIVRICLIVGAIAWFLTDPAGAINDLISLGKALGRLFGQVADGIADGAENV